MMTYQAINRSFPIKAAAVVGALTDLQEVIDSHPTVSAHDVEPSLAQLRDAQGRDSQDSIGTFMTRATKHSSSHHARRE